MNSYEQLMAALEAWLYDEDEAMNLGIAYNAHLKVEGIWLEKIEYDSDIYKYSVEAKLIRHNGKCYLLPQEVDYE
jgi:hypothetical protein